MAEILYKELSYKVVGALFKVFNELGYGYREQYYQRALAHEFTKLSIPFKQELEIPLEYDKKRLGKYRLDFLVDGKVVLELKIASRFYPQDSKQIYGYLKASGLRLGILALIARNGVRYKRIIHRP